MKKFNNKLQQDNFNAEMSDEMEKEIFNNKSEQEVFNVEIGDKVEKEFYDNTPEQEVFNEGMANRSASELSKILELTDNCVGRAYVAKKKIDILISIVKKEYDSIELSIEDNAGGVDNIIEDIMRMKNRGNTYFESQYSYGGIQAKEGLAKDGGSWKVASRTDEMIKENIFKYTESPYRIKRMPQYTVNLDKQNWEGRFEEAGTIVKIYMKRKIVISFNKEIESKFGVKQRRRQDNQMSLCEYDVELEAFVYYLKECIKEYYSGVINKGLVNFVIDYNKKQEEIRHSDEVEWQDVPSKISNEVDLSKGKVIVRMTWGLAKESSTNMLFYVGRKQNAGLYISINGRKYTCGKWVWEQQQESHHRSFVCLVELESADKNRLPKPVVEKNDFLETDERYIKLLDFIKSYVPKPIRDDSNRKMKEKLEMEKELLLMKKLEVEYSNRVTLENQWIVGRKLKCIGNKVVDIRMCLDGDVIYYELKHGRLSKDIAKQIAEYILLAWNDGDRISQYVLVGEGYSYELEEELKELGESTGIKIVCRKWSDYGIETRELIKLIE